MPIMADVATVFHWSLSDLAELDVGELMKWHALALERANPEGA